jgi:hypothetical protein
VVVAGVAVGLIVGLGGSSPSAGGPPSPTPTLAPGEVSGSQQIDLLNAATLHAADFPGGIGPATSAFTLPCNLSKAFLPENAVGRPVMSPVSAAGDYVQEYVAVPRTHSDAVAFFAHVRAEIDSCPANRLVTDSGTGTAPPVSLGVGDESIYVAERKVTLLPGHQADTQGWAVVRRGPVVFRLLVQRADRASRSEATALARTVVTRIDAAG